MIFLRALRPVVVVLVFSGCGGAPPEIEAPPPDPPPEIDTSGGQRAAPTPSASSPPAAPACASATWTIDASTRMDVPGHGPYQGAMMLDLASMQAAPNSGEEPLVPAIWAEPADPELDLHHLRITEPADLAGQSDVPRERIRSGLVLQAATDAGLRFRIEVVSFQGGPRDTARMEIRAARTDCTP